MTLDATQMVKIANASSVRLDRCGFDYTSLTTAQTEFYEYDGPQALWRDGNQLGKSLALAYWVVSLILQNHPFIKRRSPVRILVISYSIEQMVPLMEKLWMLSPKHVPGKTWRRGQAPRLVEKCGFESGRGITGQPPRLVYTDKSEIVFGTYRQGQARIAGGTFDACVMDEPPPESVYGEVLPRLLRKRGILRVVMTPVPDMPPMDWLWEKADSAEDPLHEFNFGLSEGILKPKGWPIPWLSQEEIDVYAASLLETERAMRIDGAREPLVTGRWLRAFDKARHVKKLEHASDLVDLWREKGKSRQAHSRGWWIVGSWDHGTVDGKQVFTVIAVRNKKSARPKVAILGQTYNEGITTPEADAHAALELIRSLGLSYDDFDDWVGDIPTKSHKHDVIKSNQALRRELARLLGRRIGSIREIPIPRKYDGSVTYGMRILNTLLDRDDMVVAESCEGLIKGAETFDGDRHHPWKDNLDSARYGIERACTGPVMAALHARY